LESVTGYVICDVKPLYLNSTKPEKHSSQCINIIHTIAVKDPLSFLKTVKKGLWTNLSFSFFF